MPWYGSHRYLNEFIVENNCRRILEVGVYNGDNAVSMVKAALRLSEPDMIVYYGFDFFKYYSKDRVADKLEDLGCEYMLFEGDSTDTLPEVVSSLADMDIVFIDAGKAYKVVSSDWNSVSRLMHVDTGVFFHNVDYSGVGRVVDEIPRDEYSVEVFYETGEGKIAVVKKKQ